AGSGILSQLIDGLWRPIAFWSRKFTETERRWATGQQELLTIVESLKHWRHYLDGCNDFRTDLHRPVRTCTDPVGSRDDSTLEDVYPTLTQPRLTKVSAPEIGRA